MKQATQPDVPSNQNRKRAAAIGCLCFVIAVFLVNRPVVHCADACYSHVEYWLEPPALPDGQRSVLRRLAMMMEQCPKASRYTVAWNEDGTGPFSVRPHTTVYSRKTGIIWDSNFLRLTSIRDSDIKRTAEQNGDFAALRLASMSPEAVVAEKRGQQLQDAVKSGDIVRARQLIAQGADVNYQLDETRYWFPVGETTGVIPERASPLVLAVSNNDKATTQLLLRHGARVKAPGLRGSILNHTNSVGIAKLLIEYGAGINDQRFKINGSWITDETPLMNAAKDGNTEMVRFLLARGADVFLKDSEGRTATDLTKERMQYDSGSAGEHGGTLALLKQAEASRRRNNLSISH